VCAAHHRQDLRALFLHWHHDTAYHININGTERAIPVSRGVRQGWFVQDAAVCSLLEQQTANALQEGPLHSPNDHGLITSLLKKIFF